MNGIGIVISLIVLFILAVACFSGSERDRLMKQCMEDGRKEYECTAILNSRSCSSEMILIPSPR